jgi:hypothetical protein
MGICVDRARRIRVYVIKDPILVAFFGEELHAPSSRIGSRTESADPFSGPTVDILSSTGVSLPIPLRKAAEVMCDMSLVTTNFP